MAQSNGVTTATDLYAILDSGSVANLLTSTGQTDFPVRLVTAYGALSSTTDQGIALLKKLKLENTDKLQFGLVKMMTDGSIQGFTARVKWPGYLGGAPNGIWNAPPEELLSQFEQFHRAGFQIHIHTNGDEAIDLMLDAVERALEKHPRVDHRHTLQHCQMINEAQLQRAKALGLCVNMFANHIFYWGEEHVHKTLGAERASRLEPFATADRLGVPYAMHSDAPVTPLNPLFTAWCATSRETAKGNVLGASEKIDTFKALQAITLGAAYTLKMDHLVGSIEAGKFADFVALETDPFAIPSGQLKDVRVLGTVVGGRVFNDKAGSHHGC